MRNANNYGHVVGILAEPPIIKELKNGAHSADFIVITNVDPDDGLLGKYRNSQRVKINVYLDDETKLARFQNVREGYYFACDFWVRAYTFTDQNGNKQFATSLATHHSDIVISSTGKPPVYDDIDDIYVPIPNFDDPYSDNGYIPIGRDYDGPDFDFMDTETIEEMGYDGDAEARWYGETFRGLDFGYYD